MKKLLSTILGLIVVALLITGCSSSPQDLCAPPSIPAENGCCLDNNQNGICDRNEGKEVLPEEAPSAPGKREPISEDLFVDLPEKKNEGFFSRLFAGDKEWVELGGRQCDEYPWDNYWWVVYGSQIPREERLKAFENADIKQLIILFYKEYNIDVYDVKFVRKKGSALAVCGAASGSSVKLLVKDEDAEKVREIFPAGEMIERLFGSSDESEYYIWVNITLPQCSKQKISYRGISKFGYGWMEIKPAERRERIIDFFKESAINIMDIRIEDKELPVACGEPSGYTESILVKKIYANRVKALAYGTPLDEAPAMPQIESPIEAPLILTSEQKQQICDSEVIFSIMNACVKDDNTLSITIKNDGTRDIKKIITNSYKDLTSTSQSLLEGTPSLVRAYSLEIKDANTSPINANQVTFIEIIPGIEVRGNEFVCDSIKQSFGDTGYLTALPSC